jgi:thiol-disulfide isomerase/thioredoxin
LIAYYITAPWCGPCKTFRPVAEKVFREWGISLFPLDVEDEKVVEFEQLYNVPTIIFVSEGDEVNRIPGAWPEPALRRKMEEIVGPMPESAG